MSRADLARFRPELQWTVLSKGKTLYEPGDAAEWLYFPESALLSISARLRRGAGVETNVIGCEGAVGHLEACGRRVMSAHVRVHAAGGAWRASASAYRALTSTSEALRSAAHLHTEDVVAELRQAVVCHTLHTIDQRLCRWILERQDQLGGDSLTVTQACLASLLGAQRTSVSEAAGRLQARGLIRSARAAITILDREALEKRSCECRETIAFTRQTRAPIQSASGS